MKRWLLLFLLCAAVVPALTSADGANEDYSAAQLLRLAETGDLRAAFLLGSRFAARGGDEDEVAVQWFRIAAQGGLAEAQYDLGLMLAKGRGLARDDAQAAHWFQRAADQGFPQAQFNLASFYAAGRGVKRDDAVAAAWFERAALQGLAPAQLNLGLMYQHGRGVPMDRNKALAWLEKAAAQGFSDAAERGTKLRTMLAAQPPPPRQNRKPGTASGGGEAGGVDAQAWVRGQPASAFTLQLASFKSLAAAQRFVQAQLAGREAGLYAARKRGGRWFSVVLGRYPDSNAAREAHAALPPSLRRLKPWVRRFGTIHAEMNSP